jgi:uncharacterized protein YbjT (DUF2867 family)
MKPAPTVADALAGARYQAPDETRGKTVLLAGAAGRLGERVLARLLGTQEYQRIYVLASEGMRSSESKLTTLTMDDWQCRVDHVIAVVGTGAHGTAVVGRKRTEIFSSLSADQVLALAQRAKSQDVARFMLVTPTDVLTQPAAVYAQLASLMEADLHQLDFESLLLVRPSDYEIRQRRSSIAKRLMTMVVDTATGLMVGLKHTPLSLEDSARAVVRAMLDSANGLNIIETDRLHQILRS